ncbi:MAG: hypothetical protein P1U36_04565 [Legionellaceae bacterium]|nr:hypothetical protein [Legionellaceae bacterium]
MPLLNTTYVADNINDAIAYVATNNPACTTLNLSNKHLRDPDVIRLCEALAQNTHINLLDLSGNFIGCEGAVALAQITTITSLDLSFNGIGEDGAVALAANTTLKLLNLGRNAIETGGTAAFADNTAIISLDVSCNDLCDEAAFVLAYNDTIESLDISGNNISDEGAGEIAGRNTTLKSLNMANNYLSDEGAKYFENTLLESLNVEGNDISDEQLLMLNQAIKNNRERPYVFACMKKTEQGLVTSMPIDMFQEITSFLVTDKEVLDNLRNFASPRFFQNAAAPQEQAKRALESSSSKDEPAAKKPRMG